MMAADFLTTVFFNATLGCRVHPDEQHPYRRGVRLFCLDHGGQGAAAARAESAESAESIESIESAERERSAPRERSLF